MKCSPTTVRRSLLLFVAAGALNLTPRSAEAQAKWSITSFTGRGVSGAAVGVFHDMLRDEVQQREGVTFVDLAPACSDAQCAQRAAAGSGTEVVVFGSVDALGKELIVSVRSVEVASGNVTFSQRMTVARIEELDTAAKRLAAALASGEQVEGNAELGTVTKEEAKVPERRDTRFAFLIGLNGLLPQGGYAELGSGAGVALGAFVETSHFILEPTIGYRFDLSAGDSYFGHVPLDIAMAYVFSQSDMAPILGGGLGLAFVDETQYISRTVGTVLQSTSSRQVDDTLVGLTLFPRVGFLLLRTYDVSVEVALDYVFTFADFEERSVEHSLRLGVNLVLGG